MSPTLSASVLLSPVARCKVNSHGIFRRDSKACLRAARMSSGVSKHRSMSHPYSDASKSTMDAAPHGRS